jgi:hypothetical protein
LDHWMLHVKNGPIKRGAVVMGGRREHKEHWRGENDIPFGCQTQKGGRRVQSGFPFRNSGANTPLSCATTRRLPRMASKHDRQPPASLHWRRKAYHATCGAKNVRCTRAGSTRIMREPPARQVPRSLRQHARHNRVSMRAWEQKKNVQWGRCCISAPFQDLCLPPDSFGSPDEDI